MVFLANAISLNMFDTHGVLNVKKISRLEAYSILQTGYYSIIGHDHLIKYILHDFNLPIKENREAIKVGKEDKILLFKIPSSSFYVLKSGNLKKRKKLLSSRKQIFEYYLITMKVS